MDLKPCGRPGRLTAGFLREGDGLDLLGRESRAIGSKPRDALSLVLWFAVPHVDRQSGTGMQILDRQGKPLPLPADTGVMHDNKPASSADGYGWITYRIGRSMVWNLPATADVVLRYSTDPWGPAQEVIPDSNAVHVIDDYTFVPTVAQTSDEQAMVILSHDPTCRIDRQYRVTAITNDGKQLESSSTRVVNPDKVGPTMVKFGVPLAQVKSFQVCSRSIRTVTYKNVSLVPGKTTDVAVIEGEVATSNPQVTQPPSSRPASRSRSTQPSPPRDIDFRLIRLRSGDPKDIAHRAQRLLDSIYGKYSPMVEVGDAAGTVYVTGDKEQLKSAAAVIQVLEQFAASATSPPGAWGSEGTDTVEIRTTRNGADDLALQFTWLRRGDPEAIGDRTQKMLGAIYGKQAPLVDVDVSARVLYLVGSKSQREKAMEIVSKLQDASPPVTSRSVSPRRRPGSQSVSPSSAPASEPAAQADCRLDFRIAPTEGDLSADRQTQYRQELASRGPGPAAPGDQYSWFEMQLEERGSGAITAEYGGHRYILLSNDPADSMLMGQGGPAWGLANVEARWDLAAKSMGIGITLDEAGAIPFRRFTEGHLHKRLAVLVNDGVLAAPVIQSTIGANIHISGQFTREQAEGIVQSLRPCIDRGPATQPAMK